MKTITFNPELASYLKKDNTHNIFIRITQNGQHKRVNLGYSVEKKFWNFEENCVRKTHPMAVMLNDYIKLKISELEKKLLQTKIQKKTISAKQLQQSIKNEVFGENFFKYARRVIDRFTNIGTRDHQISVLKGLAEFHGSEELSFGEIDYDFLEDYKAYLKKKKVSPNTIWSKMKTLKARYNDGIKSGLHRPDINPFTLIEIPKAKSKRVRFSENEIKMIEDYEAPINSVMFHAKNIFILSFLHWGIRISDMLMLKFVNIHNGRLVYMAKKTSEAQKTFNIKIHPRAEKIFAFYNELPHEPNDYIFPFLKTLKKKYSDAELQKMINSKTTQINNELASLATLLGLPKFSSNSARHSFAEITRKKTGNKKIVTEALGHSSEKITEAYFNSVSEYINDDLSDKIYG